MRRCSLLLTAALLAVTPALPARAADRAWDDCNQTQDLDRRITGCTEVLKRGGREIVRSRARAFENRGSAYHQKRDYDRAFADYDEAIRLNPRNAVSFYGRGVIHLVKGDYDRAIADLNESIRLGATFAPVFYHRGLTHARKGDHAQAIADFETALRLDPKEEDARTALDQSRAEQESRARAQAQAQAEERQRRDEAARQEQARNRVLDPKSSTDFWVRGNTHKERNEIDLAIADYSEAIRLDPTRSYVFLDRGIAYNEKGDYDRAIADYNQAIRLAPNNVAALSGRGLAYQEKGDFDRAIADFSEAILLKADDPWLLKYRGTAFYLRRDYDRAIADFSAIGRLKPDANAAIALGWTYEALIGRGAAHREKGDFTQALADLNEAVRLAPTYFEPYLDRGLTHARMGDHAQAVADFETALRLDPDVGNARKSEARDALDRSRAALAKGPASTEVAMQAPAAQPTDPAVASAPQEPAKAPEAQTLVPSPVEPKQKAAIIPVIDETRIALVIGNGAYSAVRALPNPARDAQAVAEALRGAGFKTVTVATDLGRAQLLEALETFADQAEAADWAVVYFAGHGLELNGTNYLVPVDARLKTDRSVLDEAVPLERVTMAIERARKLRLIVLDACRDNPFASQMRMTVATRSVSRGLARIEPEGGTLVAYAAKHGQVALDGEGRNSPFVSALVKRLSEPGLEISKLFRLVRDDVLAATGRKQEPFVYGSLPGDDFFFKPAQAN